MIGILFCVSSAASSVGESAPAAPARSPRESVRFIMLDPKPRRERGTCGDCAGELSRLFVPDDMDPRRDLGAMGESAGPRELGGHGSIDKRPRVGSSGDEFMKLPSWCRLGEVADASDRVRQMPNEETGDADPSEELSSSDPDRMSTLL